MIIHIKNYLSDRFSSSDDNIIFNNIISKNTMDYILMVVYGNNLNNTIYNNYFK